MTVAKGGHNDYPAQLAQNGSFKQIPSLLLSFGASGLVDLHGSYLKPFMRSVPEGREVVVVADTEEEEEEGVPDPLVVVAVDLASIST